MSRHSSICFMGSKTLKSTQNTLVNVTSRLFTTPADIPLQNTECKKYILFGLGNIGSSFTNTRHNVGKDQVLKQSLEQQSPQSVNSNLCDHSPNSVLLHAENKSEQILAVPDSYMNLSGKSVSKLTNALKVPQANVFVIHDDMDVPMGQVKVRSSGSSGGQKGVTDIQNHFGANSPFVRIRVGIGRPNPGVEVSDFVLSKFNTNEKEDLAFIRVHLLDLVRNITKTGIDKALNAYHQEYKKYLIQTGKIQPPPEKKKIPTPSAYTYTVQKPTKKKRADDVMSQLAGQK